MSIAKALSIFTTLACEKRGCLENTVNTVVFDIKGKKQGKHAFRGTRDLDGIWLRIWIKGIGMYRKYYIVFCVIEPCSLCDRTRVRRTPSSSS